MSAAFTILIVFLAFIINAFAGFGAGIVAVPFLVLLYPLKLVSPLMNLLGFSSNTLLIRSFYKDISYDVLTPMVIGNIIGGIIGVHFLVLASNGLLVKLLGVFTLFSVVLIFVLKDRLSIKANFMVGLIIGLISGFLSAVFAVGGVPIILYLSSIFKEKNTLRATSLAFFLLNGVTQVLLFIIHGLITKDMLLLFLISFPILIFANWLGHKLHIKTSDSLFRKVVFALLIFSGTLLLVKNN